MTIALNPARTRVPRASGAAAPTTRQAKRSVQVLHCEVRSNSKDVEPGHWFFHTGQWAICAEAGRDRDKRWRFTCRVVAEGGGQ